jgi:hypothetical protein
MNTYSLLNSVQAGSFTNTNRHIDFVYSAGGVLDMSQCFVQLICRLNTASTEVHNMVVVNTDGAISVKNIDMIRNCWLTGDKCGPLENITRVNVLQSNLMEMTKSTTEKMCMIDSLYVPRDFQEGMLLSPFVEMHKDGSVPSVYRDVYLRIPLSQLFSLGSLTVLDTAKTGTLRVHVELENLSYLRVVEAILFKEPLSALQSSMDDIGGTATSNLITELSYESLDRSPFFVGQKINVRYTGGTEQGEDVFITAILRDPVSGKLTLTTDGSFVNYADISVIEITEVLPVTFQVANANLGICEVMGASMPGDVLEYTTFTSEQYSNNARTLDKVFEVEANAINAMLMFNDNTSNMISHQDKVESYRMRIDQSDVYDRDIRVNYNDTGVLTHDPLHYDSINRTILNAGLTLKNLTFLNMVRDKTASVGGNNDLTLPERFDDKDLAQMILACPLNISAMSKKLQFTVNTKDNNDYLINGVILFKQVVRNVKLSK